MNEAKTTQARSSQDAPPRHQQSESKLSVICGYHPILLVGQYLKGRASHDLNCLFSLFPCQQQLLVVTGYTGARHLLLLLSLVILNHIEGSETWAT